MATKATEKYIEAEGTIMTGHIPVVFELSGKASGKRRNNVQVGMLEPKSLLMWDLSSDEAPFHGGDESAPEPLGLFVAGVVTCFMTQMRTFARQCGVSVTGLSTKARFEWYARREGQAPYTAHAGQFNLDVKFDTEAPLQAQKELIRVAARACFAEQVLSTPVKHRLWHGGEWVPCDE
jgi:organic hydroperoxide reductase OsmC/OhrA